MCTVTTIKHYFGVTNIILFVLIIFKRGKPKNQFKTIVNNKRI